MVCWGDADIKLGGFGSYVDANSDVVLLEEKQKQGQLQSPLAVGFLGLKVL